MTLLRTKTGLQENSVRSRIAGHIQAVMQGMLFLGFTVQIVLGIAWLCGNFMKIQNFGWHNLGRAGSEKGVFALCRSFYEFLGQQPQAVYILQLVLAFWAGYLFLLKQGERKVAGGRSRKRAFAVWGSLALLTFPFAMQCHLAVLPYSAMASLFLLMLFCLLEAVSGEKDRASGDGRRTFPLLLLFTALVCGSLALTLSGAANEDEREGIWGRGTWAALASRVAWPNIWNDYDYWTADLKEITEEAIRETSYFPGNMEILLQDIEDAVGQEQAENYYRQIVKIGWNNRAYTVVRQIGWDLLGYGAIPLIFRLQLEGRAYDSYTGRNYEIMQEHTPVLTRYYVDYGCWWFGCSLVLAAVWAGARAAGRDAGRGSSPKREGVTEHTDGAKAADGMGQGSSPKRAGVTEQMSSPERTDDPGKKRRKRARKLLPACICIAVSGIVVTLYTLRGAGLMDYRCTVAISQLWLIPGMKCVFAPFQTDGN